MSAAREKDQSDFDLERFVDMFDEAITSRDPRVMKTLRDLMMIVTLTRPESRDQGLHDRNHGPLRRVFEDINHLHRRLERVEHELQTQERSRDRERVYDYDVKRQMDDWSMKQASVLAAKIDQDVINQVKTRAKGLMEK